MAPSMPGEPSKPAAPLTPSDPVAPIAPELPAIPSAPVAPVAPVPPVTPVVPGAPAAPGEPAKPPAPAGPITPVGPLSPCGPAVPCVPGSPEGPVPPWTPDAPVEPVAPSRPVAPITPVSPVGPTLDRASVAWLGAGCRAPQAAMPRASRIAVVRRVLCKGAPEQRSVLRRRRRVKRGHRRITVGTHSALRARSEGSLPDGLACSLESTVLQAVREAPRAPAVLPYREASSLATRGVSFKPSLPESELRRDQSRLLVRSVSKCPERNRLATATMCARTGTADPSDLTHCHHAAHRL
jgi:hypothetical protein